jgi:hypothetical protein
MAAPDAALPPMTHPGVTPLQQLETQPVPAWHNLAGRQEVISSHHDCFGTYE